jgi:hypothetical protein
VQIDRSGAAAVIAAVNQGKTIPAGLPDTVG